MPPRSRPPPPPQLAKTLGVVKLVVVVNKLDDPSVATPSGGWDKGR
jgi:translation elongation factor EF-1alpha